MKSITSQEIIRKAIAHASVQHGISQKKLSLTLAEKSQNILSNWTNPACKGMPLAKVLPFAEASKMNHADTLELVAARLDEENGSQTTIDVKALRMLINYLSEPLPEDKAISDIVAEEKARIGWLPDLFANPSNQAILRKCIADIVQKEAHEASLP